MYIFLLSKPTGLNFHHDIRNEAALFRAIIKNPPFNAAEKNNNKLMMKILEGNWLLFKKIALIHAIK